MTPVAIAAHQAADRPLTEEEMHDEKPLTRGQTTGNPEASRTASQDGAITKELRQLRQMIKAIIKRIDTRHNDNEQAQVIADDLELALKVSERMR